MNKEVNMQKIEIKAWFNKDHRCENCYFYDKKNRRCLNDAPDSPCKQNPHNLRLLGRLKDETGKNNNENN